MSNELLLVGSIPFDTAQEVFDRFGTRLGPHLNALPDGEVGLRSHWISRVHYQVLALHPSIEVLRQPELDEGVERLNPRDTRDSWLFRVRDGVGSIQFGHAGWRLGFAREAVNSYFIFRTLREQGKLPGHLRFQVSILTVNSVVTTRIFADPTDAAKVKPGYEAALRAELETIVANIPAQDLAVQWDCSTEMQDAYGAIKDLPADGMVERNTEQLRRLCPLIPDRAQLGFHLCFGTLGGWPRFEPDDLSGAVAMANAFIEKVGRRVDWVHIPVLDRSDDGFFAPLADLRPRDTRIYLGAVHNMDRYPERIAAARKFLPEFGVGAYCGFGRLAQSEMPRILDDHIHALNIEPPTSGIG
ncbi:MAG: hypothetical protein V3R85_07575 [Alphaproteobacteria bacterium]